MITKIIHQVVFGEVKNEKIKSCLKSWQRLLFCGFEIKVWSYDLVLDFITEKFSYALPVFQTARNLGEASDICRYLIVSFYGGYYVDWDIKLTEVRLFIELDKQYQNGILLIDPKNGSISCEFFSAKKGDIFLLKLIEAIVETYDRQERVLMNTPQFSGPYRVQQSLHKYGGSIQNVVPIKDVFEFDYWEIRHAQESQIATRAMIHYWLNTWMAPE